MRHVTRMNESCHTLLRTSHVTRPHVTDMNESCHIYGCVMSHVCVTSHLCVSFTNESCHTYVALVICDQTSITKSYMACIVSCTWNYTLKAGSTALISVCCVTGWRRPIGCLKLQVIFCKRATIYKGLFCGKWPRKIRYVMHLRHPVPYSFVGDCVKTCWVLGLEFRHRAFLCMNKSRLNLNIHLLSVMWVKTCWGWGLGFRSRALSWLFCGLVCVCCVKTCWDRHRAAALVPPLPHHSLRSPAPYHTHTTMYMYMFAAYVYVYVYIYIRRFSVCMHTYMRAFTALVLPPFHYSLQSLAPYHIKLCMYTCMCVHTYTYIWLCTCACMHKSMCMYTAIVQPPLHHSMRSPAPYYIT